MTASLEEHPIPELGCFVLVNKIHAQNLVRVFLLVSQMSRKNYSTSCQFHTVTQILEFTTYITEKLMKIKKSKIKYKLPGNIQEFIDAIRASYRINFQCKKKEKLKDT